MVGITGVIWYPRGAAINSSALTTGAGPIPLSVAGGAWTAVSAGLADTASTVNRVMTNLRISWSGDAAESALAKFGPFEEWAERCALLAQQTGGKTQAQSTFYALATVTMPSMPEIATVETAKAAAYTFGGALNGSATAAELAAEQLKLRAAAAMETYDAASAHLAVREEFEPPPSITMPEATVLDDGQGPIVAATQIGTFAEPVRAAAAAITSATANPVSTTAASAGTATSMIPAASTVSSALSTASPATTAASAVTTTTGALGAAIGAGPGLGTSATSHMNSPLPTVAGGGGGGARHAAPTSAAATTSPRGSGAGAYAGQIAPRGTAAAITNPSVDAVRTDSLRADASRTDSARLAATSGTGPMTGGRHCAANDDNTDERNTPDYLKHFEHFADGRTVVNSVIGAPDPEMLPLEHRQ